MSVDYEIIVKGNNLRLDLGYLGLANITLIQTNAGPILHDVGHAVNRQAFIQGLEQNGLQPSDVPFVFLSHLHYDHVNNIDLFPYSTKVFVSRTEWEYAANPNPKDPWVPWMIREQLEKYDLQFIDDSCEIQNGLSCFPAPGHTPGLYGLILETAQKGTVVIAGDAIKFPKEILKGECDHAFDTPEAGARTIEHILTLGDTIIPGHFSELIRHNGNFIWDEPCELNVQIR